MKVYSDIARKTMLRAGMVLLFLAVSIGELWAQGRLLGRVSDRDGNPIVAAVISLSGEKVTSAAISNSQGYYTFLSIPEGSYKIRAIKTGQQTRQYDVTLADKTTVMMNIKLGGGEKSEERPVQPKESAVVAEKKAAQKPVVKEEKPKKPKETAVAVVPDKPQPDKQAEQLAKQDLALNQKLKEEEVPSQKEAIAEAQPQLITAEIKDENLRNVVKQAEASEELANKVVEKRVSIDGGMEAIYKYLQYPPSARNTNKAVMVIAKAFVNQNGRVSRVDMLCKAQEVFNEEVYRVLTEDIKFIPAEVDSKPVPSVMTIIVNFSPQ